MAKKDSGKITNIQYFKTQEEWKEWLRKNTKFSHVVWLQFYRPHTEKPVLEIKETLKTAKKFNWKHTLIKRIDDDSYARKFVPISETMDKPKDSPETKNETDEDVKSNTLPTIDDDVFTTKVADTKIPEDQEELVVDLPEEEADEAESVKDDNIHFTAPLDDLFEDKKSAKQEKEKAEDLEELLSDEDEELDENIVLENDLEEDDESNFTENFENEEEAVQETKDKKEEIQEIESEDRVVPEDEVFDEEIVEENPESELEITNDEKVENSEEDEEKDFVRKVTSNFKKR